jgi:hypothetical protein
MTDTVSLTVARHCVESLPGSGLSPLQRDLIESPKKIRIAHAPTGAGKSYAFERAMIDREERILFIVPTRRLCQNLAAGLAKSLEEAGWTEQAVKQKIAIWNSDATRQLKEDGETRVGARRVREIGQLNDAIPGGEMIIAVPEVVAYLLLRYGMDKGLTDKGVFDILNDFDHVVFDEFHTISPRGFGLAGLFAKLAAVHPCRARISFLSATPVEIRPVLNRLGVPEEAVEDLPEKLVPEGRAVHGDVRLSFVRCGDMAELVAARMADIRRETEKKRQVVVIYDRLIDLQAQRDRLERMFREAGYAEGRILLIDSIDDSRAGSGSGDRSGTASRAEAGGFFRVGRREDPMAFDVLVATSSVEMGVTFKADLLLMEPGFQAMNFLQRYGRAARGDWAGAVWVRVDDKALKKRDWFRRLARWADKRAGETVEIDAVRDVLTADIQKRFAECDADRPAHFGRMPNRAAFVSGLFWNVLMAHWSNIGGRWKHLQEHAPPPARTIYGLLRKVREMEKDRDFGPSAKTWCDRFEAEARVLRDIDESVRVIEDEGRGQVFHASHRWLQRFSGILDHYPVVFAADGEEEIHIPGRLTDHLDLDRPFVPATRSALFPHTPFPEVLKDDAFLVESWRRVFQKRAGVAAMAWDEYPKAMAAAEKLVALTGLVVSEDLEDGLPEAASVVM